MNYDKLFFWHVLIHYFDVKKTAAETHRLLLEVYDDKTPLERTCRVWFERFGKGDFNMKDKVSPGQEKRFVDVKLLELFEENLFETVVGLSKVLNVTPMTVLKRLRVTGRISKKGKWSLHKLSESIILTKHSNNSNEDMEESE